MVRSGLLVASVAVAGILAAGLIVASVVGARSGGTPAVASAGADAALLRGIPQDGAALGSPDAPVTLVEYADLQCPYCAQWSQTAFPELVRGYVRTGQLRMVFRGLAFVGPDSETAVRTAVAAGEQDRLWDVVRLLYANQGAENNSAG
jgi:protein-disulfide isomerase